MNMLKSSIFLLILAITFASFQSVASEPEAENTPVFIPSGSSTMKKQRAKHMNTIIAAMNANERKAAQKLHEKYSALLLAEKSKNTPRESRPALQEIRISYLEELIKVLRPSTIEKLMLAKYKRKGANTFTEPNEKLQKLFPNSFNGSNGN